MNKYLNIRLLSLGIFDSIADIIGCFAVMGFLAFVITYIVTNI